MNHIEFDFKQVKKNNLEWFDTMYPILAHNTSKKDKATIVFAGFSLNNFGRTSKRYNFDYKKDPKGISFTLRNTPIIEEKLSWAGIGNTATVYSIPIFHKPITIWGGSEWKDKIHGVFKTKDNGAKLTKALEKQGYDSIISRWSDGDGFDEIVALHPSNLLNFYTFEEAQAYYDFLNKKGK